MVAPNKLKTLLKFDAGISGHLSASRSKPSVSNGVPLLNEDGLQILTETGAPILV